MNHQVLEWLFNKAELKGRLMRWVLVLQAFKFEVCYKSEKRHCNADGISRYPERYMDDKGDDEELVN